MIKTVLAPLALAAMFVGIAGEAYAQSLEGRWRCARACTVPGGRVFIEQRGNGLSLRNEVGQGSRGYITGSRTIDAVDWGVSGRISRDGGAIHWSNGSRWER